MSSPAETLSPLLLSAKFDPLPDTPLPGVDLLSGCELYDGHIIKGCVSLSEKGGAKRTKIRPVIKTVGDAGAVEVADQLQAIAYAHVMLEGKPARYVAELTYDTGSGVETVRIYFNLKPDADVELSTDSTAGPSLEYVRGLEQQVLTLTRQANAMAQRTTMNEAKRIDLAWAGIDRAVHLEIARGQVGIDQSLAAGRERRKDKVLDGVVGYLPTLAERFLDEAGAGKVAAAAGATAPEGPPPIERMRELLDDAQMTGFEKAVGPDSFLKLNEAKDVAGAREVLLDMSRETKAALLAAIGRDNIITISEWE